MSPTAVIDSVVRAIPAEGDAAFVAQAGEPGRITSRGQSRDISSVPLTVAAIDEMNATIFPPDQLRTLQDFGLAQHDFELPGVDGTFSALAGATPAGDRWLDIRRRQTGALARPPAEAHVPPSVPVVPVAPPVQAGTPAQAIGIHDDLVDLRALEFPARKPDEDPFGFAMADDLFDGPRVAASDRPPNAVEPFVVAPSDRDHAAFGHLTRARRMLRLTLPVVVIGAAVLLATWYVAAMRAAPVSQPAAPGARAAATPPPVRPTVVPPTKPTAPPPDPVPPPASSTSASQPAAPPIAPAPPHLDESPRAGFSVQVAAVRGRDVADRMVTRLVTEGYSAYVVRGDGAAAEFYRVRIGDFPNRGAAEAVAQQLTGRDGIRPWIATNGR